MSISSNLFLNSLKCLWMIIVEKFFDKKQISNEKKFKKQNFPTLNFLNFFLINNNYIFSILLLLFLFLLMIICHSVCQPPNNKSLCTFSAAIQWSGKYSTLKNAPQIHRQRRIFQAICVRSRCIIQWVRSIIAVSSRARWREHFPSTASHKSRTYSHTSDGKFFSASSSCARVPHSTWVEGKYARAL